MKRDSMGLGPDALTLYCDASHGRLDLAFVDVSGEPRTWQGWVHKDAAEHNPHQPGLFAIKNSNYYRWVGQVRAAAAGEAPVAKLTSLNVTCSRCRTRGRLQGRTLRVNGRVLQELVIEHNLREASLAFVETYMKMRSRAV